MLVYDDVNFREILIMEKKFVIVISNPHINKTQCFIYNNKK